MMINPMPELLGAEYRAFFGFADGLDRARQLRPIHADQAREGIRRRCAELVHAVDIRAQAGNFHSRDAEGDYGQALTIALWVLLKPFRE